MGGARGERRKSYLQEDSEEDDGDGGGDEKLPAADVVGEGEGQGEGDGPSQATVGEAKLILHVEGDGAERVDDLSQHQDAWRRQGVKLVYPKPFKLHHILTYEPPPPRTEAPPHEGEEQREQDVAPVPLVLCGNGDHAQEEEDEGLGDGAQHLDHVADGRAGTLGDVFLHVVLHGEGAGHDAAGERTQQDKSEHQSTVQMYREP